MMVIKLEENKILQEIVELDEDQQKEVAENGYECPDCSGSGKVYYFPKGSVGWNNKQFTCGKCGGLGKVLTRRIPGERRFAHQVAYLYVPRIHDGGDLLFAIDGAVRVERRKKVQRAIDKN